MKPEVRINLNIDLSNLDSLPVSDAFQKINRLMNWAKNVQTQAHETYEPAPPTSPPKGEAPPPLPRPNSRHAISVAANQRISEAIEYIHKGQMFYKSPEALTVLEDLRRILLG